MRQQMLQAEVVHRSSCFAQHLCWALQWEQLLRQAEVLYLPVAPATIIMHVLQHMVTDPGVVGMLFHADGHLLERMSRDICEGLPVTDAF